MSHFWSSSPSFFCSTWSTLHIRTCQSICKKITNNLRRGISRAGRRSMKGRGTKGLPALLRLTQERRITHPVVTQPTKDATMTEPRNRKRGSNISKLARTICGASEKSWMGKKRSLEKTYKTSKETNDKVYDLNQKTSKYLETLAILYENFEHACTERKEAEDQFDMEFQELFEKWQRADRGAWKHRLPMTKLKGTSMRGWGWSAVSSKKRSRQRCP